ncbi:hypothetical protein P153DRAFT_364154 [Dothidotthia symphoricarpi CBS 119687]|uniref:DUF2406 domain-containing protein n=1 Tax=Dothidotthia symphoricarpi CBS 119687 TaxID=1392245 RepID=A0A6A6ALT3_9PLEO|nr:uncharacterized protein P153DRAFT_364154 [Dothidotthia symphoricarpi CBS 119687]KAF2132899.1 hypothetical protein P153DRAFT_364154 [Dothidotthia symphoricarpi CBS 119687]
MENTATQSPRARSDTHFSLRSNKSHDSPGKSKHEKKDSATKIHYEPKGKANPNAAMEEAQPMAAALEKPTLQSLREFQHSDANGNVIAEPDLSNPTRSRWERPLDTIRSFEAAIDGEYKRRVQSTRGDQTDIMSGFNSRRSSFYGGGPDYQQNRYSHASGYHGNRHAGRDSYDNSHDMGGPVGGQQRMRYSNRMQPDQGWNNRQNGGSNIYGPSGYQQSRDTVHTNGSNGSHSDGPYSNDPNSENSSIERGVPVQKPQPPPHGEYGYNGYNGGAPMMEQRGHQGQFSQPQNAYVPPPVAKKAMPIKLGGGAGGPPPASENRPAMVSKNSEDKRRSWFKKRFSKD